MCVCVCVCSVCVCLCVCVCVSNDCFSYIKHTDSDLDNRKGACVKRSAFRCLVIPGKWRERGSVPVDHTLCSSPALSSPLKGELVLLAG